MNDRYGLRTIAVVAGVCLCQLLTNCSSIPPSFSGAPNDCWPMGTSGNQVPSSSAPKCGSQSAGTPVVQPDNQTRGTDIVKATELSDGTFVGIALSGGGSRAANFSAAVLYYLKEAAIFDPAHAAIISSVSGGSLTAAYFAVYGDAGLITVKQKMFQDFQSSWEARWFYPGNVVRYWFTPMSRTDIMAGVFDEKLLGGKWVTYGDLPGTMPKIVLNSTSAMQNRFSFTDTSFNRLYARLGDFPIAYAAAASAAFPAAFSSVALRDYSPSNGSPLSSESRDSYVHVFDGGPSDNLGVDAIQQGILTVGRKTTAKSCLMIIVDAYPDESDEEPHTPDTRGLFGRLIDQNAMWAMDTLLTQRRLDTLRELDYWNNSQTSGSSFSVNSPLKVRNLVSGKPAILNTDPPGNRSVWVADIQNSRNVCTIWHLTFDHLPILSRDDSFSRTEPALPEKMVRIATIANSTPTLFYLKPYRNLDSATVQNAIFCAAKILVTKDQQALDRVRQIVGANASGDQSEFGNDDVCDKSFDYQ
ncbi:patatin-like phospholipase family protein [Paraburkholderia adhaesiva]|uniref:patatin-like phospholipase family protein n=1 Tax=Paraburkholderia adhaesiva TaxID=2883244 RepID=UPI001F35AEE6|nr:patatin-like phospholipase family protein [Paraburkholderia adhaesiva]